MKAEQKAVKPIRRRKTHASKDDRVVILYPTEPSIIGRQKIRRAVEKVLARRKQQS
jgi:hypothetical protein